ncbi:MAG: DNA repair protein RadC [Cytophagales bacterium]|nr:DNA repair protein RadC [Cytophagales bacterium]
MAEQNSKPFFNIKSWNEEDRPREKMLLKGKAALSDTELIAILISTGTKNHTAVDIAKIILADCENDLHVLSKKSIQQIQQYKGIGEAKAITIAAALEIGRRRKEAERPKIVKLIGSKAIYEYMRPALADLQEEQLWIIMLNNQCEVIKKMQISSGGTSYLTVDMKLIFKHTLEYAAPNIILVHNHPSGSTTPSNEDIILTQNIVNASKLLQIKVLDHIIYTDTGYSSFADEDWYSE